MRYLGQLCVILSFSLAGELLSRIVPLPVPAAVYGIVLLFAALRAGLVPLAAVRETGEFLLSSMPLLFVAPAVNLLDSLELVRGAALPTVLLIAVSTLLTFAASGAAAQRAVRGKEAKRRDGKSF